MAGTVTWRGRIDWILDRFLEKGMDSLTPWIRNVLRLGAYQICFLDKIPHRAAVDESVKLARSFGHPGVTGLVNAVLRRVSKESVDLELPSIEPDPVTAISVRHSHPPWMVRRWVDRYGPEEAAAICQANNQASHLVIRLNRLRTSAADLAARLRYEAGIATETVGGYGGAFCDYLSVPRPLGLFNTAAFREGLFLVQDPSAGIPVMLLDPKPGETIVDLCAAPGGKTSHIFMLSGLSGPSGLAGSSSVVTAIEKHPARVALLRRNMDRLGLGEVRILCADAAALGPACSDGAHTVLPALESPVDKVLVDAPCSGTGGLSKKSDARWRKSEDQIATLAALQSRLLDSACRLVRPGGTIVYSTCSIEPEENEGVLEAFLLRHEGFQVEEVPAQFRELGHLSVRTFQHRHGMDGSFCVRIRAKRQVIACSSQPVVHSLSTWLTPARDGMSASRGSSRMRGIEPRPWTTD